MQMNDSQRIPASKDRVWVALNDPEILKNAFRDVRTSKCPRRPT